MIKNKIKNIVLFFSILLLTSNTFAIPANSAVGTGSIEATGSVAATCTVTATRFEFGAISTAKTATSTVSPNCTDGTTFTITNSANTNNLYLNGIVTATDASIIAFPIVVTDGGEAFTQGNASTGKLTGTGTGSAITLTDALTSTSGTSTGKTTGSYAGTVVLNITY